MSVLCPLSSSTKCCNENLEFKKREEEGEEKILILSQCFMRQGEVALEKTPTLGSCGHLWCPFIKWRFKWSNRCISLKGLFTWIFSPFIKNKHCLFSPTHFNLIQIEKQKGRKCFRCALLIFFQSCRNKMEWEIKNTQLIATLGVTRRGRERWRGALGMHSP